MTKNHPISVISAEEANILDVLDRIMAQQGLSSRAEARRWLIEARDHLNRRKMTRGLPEGRVIDNSTDQDGSRKGNRSKRIKIANPIRTLIDETGRTIPEVLRPKTEPAIRTPEIHIPPSDSLFERALRERAASKTPRGKSYTKRYDPNSEPREKRTMPREGTKARQVYDLLKKNNWESLKTVHEAIELGIFDTSAPHARNKTAHATIGNVKQRYGPDRVKNAKNKAA